MDIKLPHLGDGIESGDVLELLVREGESVAAEQGLLELETGKATLTIPTPQAGRITKIHVRAGQTIPIGAVLVTLEGVAAASPPPAKSPPAKPAAAAAKPGPAVASPPATRPAAPQAAASAAAQQTASPVPVAAPRTPAAPASPVTSEPAVRAPLAAETAAAGGSAPLVAAGPAVRRFAREVGVDLAAVAGSGEGGRITRDDVLAVVRRAAQATQLRSPASGGPAPSAAAAPSGGATDRDSFGPVRSEPLSRTRKTIAAQMQLSCSTAPQVTNFDDADLTDLERFRQESKADYASVGIKLTTMPFIMKAVALALKANPVLNASLDMEAGQVLYKEYVNLGVAVDTERGLLVPVLRECDRLPIPEIARQLAHTAEAVRTGQFALDDLRGATFTISNLGAIGGTYSTPIVNVPEVAILLVGRARQLPVVRENDKIEARLMLPLSLSYDHRLVDGAAAARFLNDVIKFLEAPSRMLLAL